MDLGAVELMAPLKGVHLAGSWEVGRVFAVVEKKGKSMVAKTVG